MAAVRLDDAAQGQVKGSREEGRRDRERNQIHEEGILLKDFVVHPNTAAVSDHLTQAADGHADHESPCFVASS